MLELDVRKIAYLGQLERATGIRVDRIRAALHGRLPEFSLEGSPIALGLVREVRTRRGVAFEITPWGEGVATLLRKDRAAEEHEAGRRREGFARLRSK